MENISTSMKEIFLKIGANAELKIIGSMLYATFTYLFNPLHSAGLMALFILIIADMFTGISAAYKTGEHIESKKAFRTAVKVVVYFSMVALAHITQYAVPYLDFIDTTVLAFLALTELVSNLENFGKLGFTIPLRLLNKLRERADPDELVRQEIEV